MNSLEAIFVDFDGTLVNTEIANAKAYSRALESCGFNISPEVIYQNCVGKHWSQFLPSVLGDKYTSSLGHAVSIEKKKIYSEYFSEVTLNTSLLQLLSSTNSSIPKALVTNASRQGVLAILESFALKSFFKLILCQEDVKEPKPNPECYLLATMLLKVKGENCIAIEDSETGILAANLAGIPTIKILNKF